MTMITPSYLGETIEYSSLHACRSTLEDPTDQQSQMLHSGSSYLSQSELVLTFGLGSASKADSVELQWPSGQVDKLSNIAAGETITVQEGKGVVGARPYSPLVLPKSK